MAKSYPVVAFYSSDMIRSISKREEVWADGFAATPLGALRLARGAFKVLASRYRWKIKPNGTVRDVHLAEYDEGPVWEVYVLS